MCYKLRLPRVYLVNRAVFKTKKDNMKKIIFLSLLCSFFVNSHVHASWGQTSGDDVIKMENGDLVPKDLFSDENLKQVPSKHQLFNEVELTQFLKVLGKVDMGLALAINNNLHKIPIFFRESKDIKEKMKSLRSGEQLRACERVSINQNADDDYIVCFTDLFFDKNTKKQHLILVHEAFHHENRSEDLVKSATHELNNIVVEISDSKSLNKSTIKYLKQKTSALVASYKIKLPDVKIIDSILSDKTYAQTDEEELLKVLFFEEGDFDLRCTLIHEISVGFNEYSKKIYNVLNSIRLTNNINLFSNWGNYSQCNQETQIRALVKAEKFFPPLQKFIILDAENRHSVIEIRESKRCEDPILKPFYSDEIESGLRESLESVRKLRAVNDELSTFVKDPNNDPTLRVIIDMVKNGEINLDRIDRSESALQNKLNIVLENKKLCNQRKTKKGRNH